MGDQRDTGPNINPPEHHQQKVAAPLLQAGFRASMQAKPELSNGGQLAFGLHDDAIRAYGRAVFNWSLGKLRS